MGTISEIKEIPEKYKKYRDKIIELFKQNDINSISSLVAMYKANPQFKENWKKIWVEVSKEDGGKISLTTVGVIIGSALGGIGVATMGSAIGVPLALVLGLGGFLTGTKFDSLRIFSNNKSVTISIPKDLYAKIESDAKTLDQSVSKYVELIIEQAYE
tara:strand:- start:1475 stop:1948 length:474 start_codon:yes stop_codon:yes gene_type:complete